MNPHTIIFLGPQGSGKGTQIELLAEALRARSPQERVVMLQTGRLFRALAERGVSYTERRVGETLPQGALQPHFLTVMLWADALVSQLDPASHLLIDGVPRTRAQAEALDEAFAFYGREQITVINFCVSETVARERMVHRARSDDTLPAIKERLRLYREETPPLLDFYRARRGTTVLDIDAGGTVEAIHEEILHGLESSGVSV